MAKQVLDLYELYRLVVARGGLVEVINKKIWREITKGLNLPSSITSAAFTLRTQYMKYLYPYECEKERLSAPDELQQAIDGNRREGRRSSYGQYAEIVGSTPPPVGGHVSSRNHSSSHHHTSPLGSLPLSLVSRHHAISSQLNGHNSQGVSSGEEDNGSMSSSTPTHLHLHSPPAQQEAPLNLEVKGSGGGLGGLGGLGNGGGAPVSLRGAERDVLEASARAAMEVTSRKMMEEALGMAPSKRHASSFLSDSDLAERYILNAGLPSAHIKISSRGSSRASAQSRRSSSHRHLTSCSPPPPSSSLPADNGRTQLENGSLMVSMEINGTIYQGVFSPKPLPPTELAFRNSFFSPLLSNI